MKLFTALIILADNLLNWFLAVALTVFLDWFAGLLAPQLLAPLWLYVVTGVGFAGFAGWQLQVFVRPLMRTGLEGNWLRPTYLRQAAIMAWLPVVVLTTVLLTPLAEPLYPTPRTLLWIGDGYMVVLGMWYWWVARRV